jgi:uncharacterized protein YcnI
VRRLAILTLTTALATTSVVALTVLPASAHICPVPVQIAVGQAAGIDVGVTVEGATVPDVEIDIPPGLQLNRIDPKADWTFTRTFGPTGTKVRYHGGPIQRFTCEYFSLGVTAPAKGTFGIPVTQRTATGNVVSVTTPNPQSAQDRALDQFVYAGVKPPPGPGSSSGLSTTTIAGIALVGLGAVALAIFGFRAWRNRGYDEDDLDDVGSDSNSGIGGSSGNDDRDAEIRARLEQFKKRK